MVNGQPQPARYFYPKPESVWVREINEALEEFVDSAFKVEPNEDTVESLVEAIRAELGIKSPHPMCIYKLDHQQRFKLIEDVNSVLYENREEQAYGFYVRE